MDCKILAWNVRGASSKRNHSHIRDNLRKYSPDLVFLFEVHVQFARVRRFWDSLGYQVVEIQEARGHAGGIWVLQLSSSVFTFKNVNSTNQVVSIEVFKGSHIWICSGVYASPTPTERVRLWDYLCSLRASFHLPWVLVGDFNETLLPSDQRGGLFSHSRAALFGRMIDECDLLTLDQVGGRFT
ncbi:uncharacterized protein LOC109810390 [Cajanus cajan]|uniref:uncharacterized protein LOC109810390 n=1 Tax=Cajanus cajan TaxID=3821 RepID=UPI00098DA33E|nr:uncharacterized protein LOC109810390 [Cajanus cajan]